MTHEAGSRVGLKGWTTFGLLTAIWGASFLFIKIALETLPPLTIVALRLTLGAILVWALVLPRRPSLRRIPWGAMLFVGLTNSAVPFVLITWGEQYIPSGIAALVNGAVPIFAAILSHWALQEERLSLLQWGGVLLGFFSLGWLFFPDVWQAWHGLATWDGVLGQLAVVLASVCYAVGTVYARKHLRTFDPFLSAASQLTWGAALLWPLAFAVGSGLSWAAFPPRTLLAIGWLGLLSSGVAYVLYYALLRIMGATQVAMVTYVIPIVGLILGALVLHEPIGWHVILALGLILTSIVVVNRPAKREPTVAVVRGTGR